MRRLKKNEKFEKKVTKDSGMKVPRAHLGKGLIRPWVWCVGLRAPRSLLGVGVFLSGSPTKNVKKCVLLP